MPFGRPVDSFQTRSLGFSFQLSGKSFLRKAAPRRFRWWNFAFSRPPHSVKNSVDFWWQIFFHIFPRKNGLKFVTPQTSENFTTLSTARREIYHLELALGATSSKVSKKQRSKGHLRVVFETQGFVVLQGYFVGAPLTENLLVEFWWGSATPKMRHTPGKIPERPRKRSQSVSWNSSREYGWDPPRPIIQGIWGFQSISRIFSPPVRLGTPLFSEVVPERASQGRSSNSQQYWGYFWKKTSGKKNPFEELLMKKTGSEEGTWTFET